MGIYFILEYCENNKRSLENDKYLRPPSKETGR